MPAASFKYRNYHIIWYKHAQLSYAFFRKNMYLNYFWVWFFVNILHILTET